MRSVFSAAMTLLPPAWHAAQLPAKMVAPDSMSPCGRAELSGNRGTRGGGASGGASGTPGTHGEGRDGGEEGRGAEDGGGNLSGAVQNIALMAASGGVSNLVLRRRQLGGRARRLAGGLEGRDGGEEESESELGHGLNLKDRRSIKTRAGNARRRNSVSGRAPCQARRGGGGGGRRCAREAGTREDSDAEAMLVVL